MDAFIATIILYAGNFAPQGWAFCHGQLLSVSQHSALFSLIGTTYGGDGVNNFNLPDLRGRVAVGFGAGPGLAARAIGQRGGAEAVTLNNMQLPAHTHPLLATDQASDVGTAAGAALAPTDNAVDGTLGTPIYKIAPPNKPMAVGSIGEAGGSQPHDNMPPYLGLNYLICLQGLYPPRN